MTKSNSLPAFFFVISLLLFLAVLLYKIEDFPIYFFVDEAVQATKAEMLLKSGLKDAGGKFLPLILHRVGNLYNLGITVYFNMPGIWLFGKKIWVVRATTVLISLLAALFTSKIMKNFFKMKNYWVSVLFLPLIPIFFIQARTGFETVITTSFYAGLIYFYLLYREYHPLYLIPAVFFSALSFYSYSGIYMVIIATLTLLTLIDIKFHIKNIKWCLLGILVFIVCFFPFYSFVRKNSDKMEEQAKIYSIYFTKKNSFNNKLNTFLNQYGQAFNPNLLFLYDSKYLTPYHERHQIKDFGYFPLWSLPFILIGAVVLILGIAKPGQSDYSRLASSLPHGRSHNGRK